MTKKKELELYIHIPFCVKKCDYCDFLSFPAGEETQRKYLMNLLREIQCWGAKAEEYEVATIFLGGGTPSYINPEWIKRILDTIHDNFYVSRDVEVSMECNPGTLTKEKLDIYHDAGVNRISIGLQSADNKELKVLGRIHTWEQFLDSYYAALDAGFENINIDLISGLPGQKVSDFKRTLDKVLELRPNHLSVYSLIVEEGTPFYERYEADMILREKGIVPKFLPSEDEEYRIYKLTQRMLREHGYEQYEISNYSIPGKSCRHNIGYWTGVEYIGMGLGASSCFDGKRFSITEDLNTYNAIIPDLYHVAPLRKKKLGHMLQQNRIEREQTAEDKWKDLLVDVEEVTVQSAMEEFMFLGLRMVKGVSPVEFETRFGKTIDSVYGSVIDDLIAKGLMMRTGGRLQLTERGLDLGNYCMAKFLLGD